MGRNLAARTFGRLSASARRHPVLKKEGRKMRKLIIALSMLFLSATSALAQVSIGIHISLFPELVRVPAYPVYYAPRMGINFFFYDGLYWVYQGDSWYSSTWYNGPWMFVGPEVVPLFVLRIPVRYYVSPPPYFRRWSPDRPPRWDEHWGRDWEQRRSGWDRWERHSVPAPAPLPIYQKKYSGERYPSIDRQHVLHHENYRYQPRESIVPRAGRMQADRPPKGNDDVRRPAPPEAQPRPRGPAADERMPQREPAQRERSAPKAGPDDSRSGPGPAPEPRRGQGQAKERDDREPGQERGQGRNR
jgi:hypothetical protein